MGPILFVLFSVFTFILMSVVHDAIQTFYAQKIILGVGDLTLATSLIITLMNISSISESCLEALHQLSSYHRHVFMDSPVDLKFEHMLVMHEIDSKTRMTALGFYPADRTSMLGAVGTSATFLLIILQNSVFK
ncbi:uncharacterized protein LOC111698391 [Eurytemora carolleeae]|uniref:uncharacterized protein LOC111698391 n=1 Tax=Eurytemora carolleeae TaxID=1294199 RepID=UPI000C76689D|nr:uncharacterized protein LOC111698391 [Eurytemora carolleeae]|eukprot:XP_023324481.1 uncharacterized protein LOC111698391 [Eurytemora affinis]